VVVTVGAFIAAVVTDAVAARRPSQPPSAQGAFVDRLLAYDTNRWIKADRWTNGSPFANAWRADHVAHNAGGMWITLSDRAYLGKPYSAGEYRSRGYYGYGCYEARFRAVKSPGVVTSFFTFAGPYDNGGNGRHNEIDIEFVGLDTRSVQFNFWTNDDAYASSNAVTIPLNYDAALEAHEYAFKWTSRGIRWYVDRQLVHEAVDSPASNPTPKATESLQKIMMNVWPVDATAAGWAGSFTYPGAPLRAQYEWVRYTPGEDCEPRGAP
jgi:beta-glucanase (GH16 family)